MTLDILQRKPVADTRQDYFFRLAATDLSYVLSHIPQSLLYQSWSTGWNESQKSVDMSNI